ncbi:MAG: ABC transporter permease [Anaerolineae bacterium]|nr:ABC transporter permease [Anaerolineae bacterium]
MTGVWRVLRYELLRQGRRRGYLFITVGIPLIALLLFYGLRAYQSMRPPDGSPFGSNANRPGSGVNIQELRPSGYVDQSGLLGTGNPLSLIRFNTVEEAQAALRANRIGAYYVIAADYLQSGRVDMYFDRFNLGNINNSPLRQAIVRALIAKSGKQIDPATIDRLQAREPTITSHTVNETGSIRQAVGEGASFALVYLFAMLLLLSSFTTSGYLMQSVLEEKESRMVEILLSSVRPGSLLAGKILALGLLGLAQMVLWAATAVFIIRQVVPASPEMVGLNVTPSQIIVLFVYFILGYLLFASAYASIGALSNSMREGPQLAAFITLPAVVPMWAIPLFTSAPDGPLAVILSIFPITAPLAMVMRIAITDVPLIQIVISVVLLTLMVIVQMWIAGRLFRVNTLLSGHMPSLRELPRLVRESI